MEFNWESGIINNKEDPGGGEGGGAEEVGFMVIYMASDHDWLYRAIPSISSI